MTKTIKSALPDVLLIAGAGSLSYGAWAIYAPAGWIVAGTLAIVAAIHLARAE